MESLFLSLWNRSVAAGWLILAVIALRLVLRRGPKSIRPWLWALVGVRLVWPRFGQSPLSLLPSAETIPQAALTQPSPRVQSGVAFFNSTVNDYLGSHVFEGVTRPVGYTRSVVFTCAVVWLVGMVLLAAWASVSYLRLRHQVAEAVPEGDNVWVCNRIDSPFLLGIVKPRIYLPTGLEDSSRTYVLAHERTHIRRRDYLVKPLGLLLLTVYWFQPLVWVAYVLLCRDIELACDERVIAELGAACKKPYSSALLACSVHRGGLTALAFGEVGVKERVKNVLNYKKPAFWVVAACVAAVIVAGVCFLTDPVTPKEPENPVSFTNLSTNQPAEPEVFVAGALLHQNMAMDYMPADGSSYNPILYGGDTLTLTQGYPGTPVTYKLAETVSMAWDNLYDYFSGLKEMEEVFGATLVEHNDLTITARFYEQDRTNSGSATDAPQDRPSIWTVQQENGGQQWWLYIGMRLYALIRLDDAFPFMANGALWTYVPSQSTILPIRFDIEGGAEVYAGAGGLSLHPVEGEWADHLTVEESQTVYWKPPLNSEDRPIEGAGLRYYYTCQLPTMNTPYQGNETLELRSVMNYTSMSGGMTYGISNNWLGAFSSAIHLTSLTVDHETGELVVSRFEDSGSMPYMTRWNENEPVGSVWGTTGPVLTEDAPAE